MTRQPATASGRHYAIQPPGSLAEWEEAILAIESEAAAEGLDVERLATALHIENGHIRPDRLNACDYCRQRGRDILDILARLAAAEGLNVERMGYEDLLNVAQALLRRYPPDSIVCSHRDEADIGARSTAAIADLVESCLRLTAAERFNREGMRLPPATGDAFAEQEEES